MSDMIVKNLLADSLYMTCGKAYTSHSHDYEYLIGVYEKVPTNTFPKTGEAIPVVLERMAGFSSKAQAKRHGEKAFNHFYNAILEA